MNDKPRINYNSYLFISTDNDSLLKKSEDLLLSRYKFTDIVCKSRRYTRIYYLSTLPKGIYYSIGINEISLEPLTERVSRIEEEIVDLKNEHSLQSFAWIKNDRKFYCNSDYLGVFTHYYYQNNLSFVSSDNLLLIANLSDSKFSVDGIFDAILFKKPFGSNTWYEKISCLTAGTILCYDMENSEIRKSGGTNFEELLNGNRTNLAVTFMEVFQTSLNSKEIALSLSSGSDSRSVLAGLLNRNIPFKAISWGGERYLESKKIEDLVKKLKIEWKPVNFIKLQEDFLYFHFRSVYFSNGLIPAIHHYYYRSCLPRNIILYEGYGGSEFVKGEHSDGMYSDIFKAIVKNNSTCIGSLREYLPMIEESLIKKVNEYLLDKYSYYFKGINTQEGKESFQQYLLTFLPSKIFGGIFKSSAVFGLDLIEPYFSPKILATFFGNELGIKENLSLRKDFSGSIKCIKPQSLLLKDISSEVYSSMLDRNIRYSEWNYPTFVIKPVQKLRQQIDKILYHDYNIRSQVDYVSLEKHKGTLLHDRKIESYIPGFSSNLNNSLLNNIEIYLSALSHCSGSEYIKEVISND